MSVSWALSLLSLVAVFHSLQCQTCTSNQDCSVSYTRAPAALSNSPLYCSMEGRQVTITCEMATPGDVRIIWYYTSDRKQAGMSLNNEFTGTTLPVTGSAWVRSTLSIDSFNSSQHNGFYWCERDPFVGPCTHSILPSPIVHIENQLLEEQCSQTTFDFTAPFTRCAFGVFSLRNITIVTGVEFTNSTPTAFPMTTMNDSSKTNTTTSIPTPITTPTTLVMTEEEAIRGSSNTVRTAIIWFSVGIVALLLIVGAVILCGVAIAKN